MMTPPVHRTVSRVGFTLIELLTVMAIIVILAGLILGTAGFANRKAASSRAQAEIKALEAAINNYQVDNGTVPRDKNSTDLLDARASAKTGNGYPGSDYQKASLFLFRTLSGYYDMSGANPVVSLNQKVYFPFKGNQVAPTTATNVNGSITPGSVTSIIDPFGLSYGYSTAALADADGAAATDQKRGFNPTFDLWSTGGYSTGKPYPTGAGTADKSVFWITNWSSSQ